MDSRERVATAMAHRAPDRVPFNFWMDRPAMDALDKKHGADFRIRHYGADVLEVFPAVPWWSEIHQSRVATETTSWATRPLAETTEEALRFPLPDMRRDEIYEPIRIARKEYPKTALFPLILTPFEHFYEGLRMQEGGSLDLYDCPDLVHRLLASLRDKVDYLVERLCRMDVDAIYMAGDICGKSGPLVSKEHLREFNFEYLRRTVEIVHGAGKRILYHTDGRVMEILDLFVEYGFDGINNLQYNLNDSKGFAEGYGGKLFLYGGMDNIDILPNGSDDEIVRHIRRQFETVGSSGGLILSSHDIPGSVPESRIDLIVKTIKSCTY